MRGVLQKGLGWMLLSIWLLGLGGLQAQSWEHKYKWRDNNRYKEGLKLKKKKMSPAPCNWFPCRCIRPNGRRTLPLPVIPP